MEQDFVRPGAYNLLGSGSGSLGNGMNKSIMGGERLCRALLANLRRNWGFFLGGFGWVWDLGPEWRHLGSLGKRSPRGGGITLEYPQGWGRSCSPMDGDQGVLNPDSTDPK